MIHILTSILNGKSHQSGSHEPVVNPYTHQTIAEIVRTQDISIPPHQHTDSSADTCSLARLAMRTWRTALHERSMKDVLLTQVTNETGSPISYHKEDLEATLTYLSAFESAKDFQDPRFEYGPKGNILIVLCANEPISVTTILLFSALLAGNTVYIKPSSKTPSFAYRLVHTLTRIPKLKTRVHLLLIDRSETERLILARSFDAVLSFGGSETSRKLALLCAQVSIEFIEESEGCDWAYVDTSASRLQDVAQTLVIASTRHNGQMCNAVRGIMIHRDIYKDFLSAYTHAFSSRVVGDPLSSQSHIGALLLGTQTHAENIIREHQNTLGIPMCTTPPYGFYTITKTNIHALTTPTFAPLVWIMPVANHVEALTLHNMHNNFGLGFSLFAKQSIVQKTLTRHIQAGRINVNTDPLNIGPFDPIGGIRISGRGGPKFWLEKLSNRKFVVR
jgi:acyl-CoA reductase-like NAD-dependent aldehyde dehydrogenase